ncbi:glycosyltransferase family 4 protein [Pseudactinotalea sp.]|uniref:glycosyltransferase family 4 protein n=1 Tax=Pseudactinotalea sp. TaxID=1926260 RepID=UPI003B39FC44
MRIAIVAESFLPHTNGVTGSVLRTLAHLQARGHEAVVLAAGHGAPVEHDGAPVLHLPSLPLPGYPRVRLNMAGQRRVADLLTAVEPDVVHLAAPMLLGHKAVRAAATLGLPTVAVFQTDIAAYAERYGFPGWSERVWARIGEIHEQADLTLVPSTQYRDELGRRGVQRLQMWGRGVDQAQFDPAHRSEAMRNGWGVEPGEVVVGYLGRLAPEKQVDDLAALAGIPGVRLVLVGDGPARASVAAALPDAVMTGHLAGTELGAAVASFDILVAPGESETFCQSLQEALAAGVPVVAPAAGGPRDLVDVSRTGWLYAPGDLAGLRSAVVDLVGDERKRRAFGRAARAAVVDRTWARIGDELIDHYRWARAHAAGTSSGGARER